MKTLTKTLAMLMAAAVFAAGCVNEDPPYKNEGGEPGAEVGYLAFDDLSMRVIYDPVTDTQDTRVVTRATPDVDDFIVEIINSSNEVVLDTTYGALKAELLDEPMELPVGAYRIEVRSEETMPTVAWENPFYGASRTFTILKAQTTPIEEIVCTLQNIKVTAGYAADLFDIISPETTATVSLDNASMVFVKGETRAAYFKPLAVENTLQYRLAGSFSDTNAPISMNRTITGVKGGQWRKITVVIEHANEGEILLDIEVDSFIQDEEVVVDGTAGLWEPLIDENGDAPTFVWPGHDLSQPFALTEAMFEQGGASYEPFAFDVTSPTGIESFEIGIASTSSEFLASLATLQIPTSFDLCTLSPSAMPGTLLNAFGYPLGDQIQGRTTCHFEIAAQIEALYAFEGTHTFTFEITDADNSSVEATLTLVVDKGGSEEGGPSIVWDGYDIDVQHPITPDMTIDLTVTAPAGIKSLVVEIDSEALTPELPTMGIPTTFDLASLDDELATMFSEEFMFPVNAQVKDKTSLPLSITVFAPLLMNFPGEHNFILTVTDNNDVVVSKTIQLIYTL